MHTTLKNGSSGEEVKKLQQSLVNAGYSVGSAGVDGIYGDDTASAVRSYQQANGLTSNGVADDATLGSLYTPKTTAPAQSTAQTTPQATTQATMPQRSSDGNLYSPAYQAALDALTRAQDTMPTYAATYDAQLQDIYNQIVNRDKFSYDINGDALYQQYKDQYATMGQMAMMDTMGQAATLTGGYGNSYAQTAGQQAYQGYLQQLNAVVPELYGLARDNYDAEGEALLNQYAMLGDMADAEYGRYQDQLNQYWQNLSYLKGQADDAYDKQNASYERLVSLITSTGYAPTEEELVAAGMSKPEADAYANYYAQQAVGSGGSNGGSGGGSGGSGNGRGNGTVWDTSKYSTGLIKRAQELVGAYPTGTWDADSTSRAIDAGYEDFASLVTQMNVDAGNYFAVVDGDVTAIRELPDPEMYDGKTTSTQVAGAATSFAQQHQGAPVSQGMVNAYIRSQGYGTEAALAFEAYLDALGVTIGVGTGNRH